MSKSDTTPHDARVRPNSPRGSVTTTHTIGSEASTSVSSNHERSERDIEKSDVEKGAAEKSDSPIMLPEVAAESAVAPQIRERADLEGQQNSPDHEELEPPIPIPRARRRGLLAWLSIVDEVEEPKNYRRSTKWFITFVVAVAAIAAPVGSTIIISSLPEVAKELNSSPTIANLSVALYMLSLAIFPIFWSSFSEALGRRTIYISSFTLFIIFNILSAKAVNIAMLVVTRILAGGASGSVQAVGAGTIADIWHVHERGRAMSMFYLGPMMGPLLAPIIGGALQIKWGWRSGMWFLVIYGVVTWVFLVFCLPETLKHTRHFVALTSEDESTNALSRVSSRQSIKLKGKRTARILYAIFIEPLKVVRYLQFPAVALTVYYASVTFGSLYVLQISIQATFSKAPYNFSSLEVGLCYIANSMGYITSSLFGGRWTDKIMRRTAIRANRYDESGQLVYHPEDRMKENIWIAAFMYPAAMLWYGWSSEKHAFFIIPLIANYFFGMGTMLVFSTVTTMLTEFMPRKSSSGVALNNLFRNTCSAIGGVVAQPLLDTIGSGWTFTGLGIICGGSSVVIWVMRHYGPRWRTTMDERLQSEEL